MKNNDIITEQAEKIRNSGVLGRSRSYANLFEYLVKCSIAGHTPKELEIATEVFARDGDFDPSQDSMVRVYAHNLRQKLKQFYADAGASEAHHIEIPRGEYRFAVVVPNGVDKADATNKNANRSRWLVGATVITALLAGVVIGIVLNAEPESPYAAVAESPLWNEILDDEIPVIVIVGDYYIFGELDEDGTVSRFVREFSINSRDDLDAYLRRNSSLSSRYQDLNLTYLASSSASAFRDVLRILYTSAKPVQVVPMSEFDPADMRSNHVVYVGYLSALDKLFEFVFSGSSLAIGETFDELWNLDTGEFYTSTAGLPADIRNYRDYGFFSTFPGPSGNQFAVIAGTRDEGVMHAAQLVSNPIYLASALQNIPVSEGDNVTAFELLYEVTGFDRTNIDAMLVYSGVLNYREIWRGDLLQSTRP